MSVYDVDPTRRVMKSTICTRIRSTSTNGTLFLVLVCNGEKSTTTTVWIPRHQDTSHWRQSLISRISTRDYTKTSLMTDCWGCVLAETKDFHADVSLSHMTSIQQAFECGCWCVLSTLFGLDCFDDETYFISIADTKEECLSSSPPWYLLPKQSPWLLHYY